MKWVGQHAVVIGASMGGMLAARVLADAYERVTLLERDRFPNGVAPRKGVPQGRHAHALLPKGGEIVEGFFPGITNELIGRGAVPIDMMAQIRWFDGEGYRCRGTSGTIGLGMSRPLLDDQVRTRLLQLPNVRAEQGIDVQGLVPRADGTGVAGVRVRSADERVEEREIAADLVVDASGRGSQAPAWLRTLGYPAPAEERIRVDVGYSTRLYRRRPGEMDGDGFCLVGPTRAVKRFCFFQAQEDDQWLVSLGGYLGDHPPADDAGFLAFAQALPAPDAYEVIRSAEPLSEPVPHKFPANQRRRYERLARLPRGFLAFGDAICSFNPTYGQGMSVAALEATALQRCLAAGDAALPRRFYKAATRVTDVAWNIAAGGDLRFPEVAGPRPPMVRFLNWYIARLQRAAQRDPVLAETFVRVFAFLDPPTALLTPAVAARVMAGNLRYTERDRTRYRTPLRVAG